MAFFGLRGATRVLGQMELRLREMPTAEQLSNGAWIEIAATSEDGFQPQVNDFRLEKIEPANCWIPVQFGATDFEFALADGRQVHRVDLHIRPMFDFREQMAQMEKLKPLLRDSLPLHGECPLEAGGKYRLTWSVKAVNSKRTVKRSCEFAIDPETRGLPSAADAQRMWRPYFWGEVLFHDDQGNLFLGQRLLCDLGRTAAVSFAGGNYIRPPDPGVLGIKENLQMVNLADDAISPRPPLARQTSHWEMSRIQQRNDLIQFSVSDLATRVPFDSSKQSSLLFVFSDALFRVQVIESNVEKLRQDETYWKTRTSEILDEARAHESETIRNWARKQVKANLGN